MASKLITHQFSVIVLGSGISGMCASLEASKTKSTAIISRDDVTKTNSYLAQAGIAASVADQDSPELHFADTLKASAGLGNYQHIKLLTETAPEIIDSLEQLGIKFDKSASDSHYELSQEGAHSTKRILRCSGDQTGKQISEQLSQRVTEHNNIAEFTGQTLLKLLIRDNICFGALTIDSGGNFHLFLSETTIIASGGYAALLNRSSNSTNALGDPIGEAVLSGVATADLEFIQFHPTAYEHSGVCRLISEAVRGEQAKLVNDHGISIMEGIHPLKELGPRDIVAATIYHHLQQGQNVYLDATHLSEEYVKARFPGISNMLAKYNLSLAQNSIPITPVAHYAIGGILTYSGVYTNIKGLMAVGEASSTGVHGANRLASNSLLEGAVFGFEAGKRAGQTEIKYNNDDLHSYFMDKYTHFIDELVTMNDTEAIFENLHLSSNYNRELITQVSRILWESAGVSRSEGQILEGKKAIQELTEIYINDINPRQLAKTPKLLTIYHELIPSRKILTLARLILEFSLKRQETRGVHRRKDYPGARDDFQYRQAYHIEKGWMKIDDNSPQVVGKGDY